MKAETAKVEEIEGVEGETEPGVSWGIAPETEEGSENVERVAEPVEAQPVKESPIKLIDGALAELVVIFRYASLVKSHRNRLERAGTMLLRLRDLLEKEAAGVADQLEQSVRRCRVCGCTDDEGCLEGCYWVEEGLCSSCVSSGEYQGEEL